MANDNTRSLPGRPELMVLAPESRVTLTIEKPNGDVERHSGTITECDRTLPIRHVETRNHTLLLEVTPARQNIIASGVSSKETTRIGTLRDITLLYRPIEMIRITDTGVEIPPWLVGYSGSYFLTESDGFRSKQIDDPGLGIYDNRIIATDSGGYIPTDYENYSVEIEPHECGFYVEYSLLDDRSNGSGSTADQVSQTKTPSLGAAFEHITEFSELVVADDTLSSTTRDRATKTLQRLRQNLHELRIVLYESAIPCEQTTVKSSNLNQGPNPYEDLLAKIAFHIRVLIEFVTANESLSCIRRQRATAAVQLSSRRLTELRWWLSVPKQPDQLTAVTSPPPKHNIHPKEPVANHPTQQREHHE